MVGTGTEKGGGDRASYRDPGTRRPARWRPKVRGEAGPRPAVGRSLGRCWKGGEALGRGRVAEFHLHLPRGSSRACRQEPGSHLCVSDASVQTFSLCFSLPNCAICFLVFEFCGVFMFSGYKSFLRPLISKYFLLVYGLHFILVTILQNTIFLVLMRSSFVFFIYQSHFWCLRTKDSQPQSFSQARLEFFS